MNKARAPMLSTLAALGLIVVAVLAFIESSTLSKFAPGWDVNLPMACRIVGDELEGYGGAYITALPMTVRPTDAAMDSELELQVMLTRGDSVKGAVEQGLVSNYLVKKVRLRVIEP